METELSIPDFNSIGEGLMEDIVSYAAVTGVNFFKSSFDNQGFTDEKFEAWPKTKDGDGTRHILTNSGFLRDSNQVLSRSIEEIVFGNPAPYASIHNFGGVVSIRVTKKARKFFWYMYRATGNIKWKYMALTKKERLAITIPARPFLKESKTLLEDIDKYALKEIVNRYNNANR